MKIVVLEATNLNPTADVRRQVVLHANLSYHRVGLGELGWGVPPGSSGRAMRPAAWCRPRLSTINFPRCVMCRSPYSYLSSNGAEDLFRELVNHLYPRLCLAYHFCAVNFHPCVSDSTHKSQCWAKFGVPIRYLPHGHDIWIKLVLITPWIHS
jgi:hypothetical protein